MTSRKIINSKLKEAVDSVLPITIIVAVLCFFFIPVGSGLMLAFLIGHSLNMALNLLGTFVHTSRLQYIEFFGKFYEDGGRAYQPLTPQSRFVLFR